MGDAATVSPRPLRRDLPWFLAIALVGLVLRLAAVAQYQASHPNSAHVVIDEKSYDSWARAIAGGEWMGTEVFFQEPLYPYALGSLYATLGESLYVARVAHCVLWSVAILLVGLLARRIFGSACGFIAAAAVALYGPGLLFPSLILKENLFLPVFAALLLAIVASRPLVGRNAFGAWLAIGILGGLGSLLRGNVLILLPVLAAWPIARALFERMRVKPAVPLAAAFVVGAALVLLPVAWRNHHVGGVFALTTSGAGTNVYGGNNLENPFGRATEFSFIRGIPEYEAGDWKREAERRTGRVLDPAAVSSYWMGEAWRSAREQPLEHARILWRKLRLSLGGYEVPDNHMLDWDARYVAVARLPWPDFGVTGMLGIAGVLTWVVLAVARRKPLVPCAGGASETAILFALYLGTIVLTVTSDRARLPLLVPLAAFAAFFVVTSVAWIRTRARFEIVVAVGSLVVAALFAHVPALPASDRAEDWDERDYNLAVQFLDEPGRETEGRRLAESLSAKYPRTARMQLLAQTFAARRAVRMLAESRGMATVHGGTDVREVEYQAQRAAEESLHQAMRIADDPSVFPRERFRANALAAFVALELRQHDEAVRRFGWARAFDPDSPELRNGEARARLALSSDRLSIADSTLTEDEDRPRYVEEALDLYQLVAQDRDVDPALRADARRAAGWIQYGLNRLPQAERHFRAARELDDEPAARLGLAHVLALRALAVAPGPDREVFTLELRLLVQNLDAEALATGPLAPQLQELGLR